MWKSASAADAKQKGVRKAALVPVAESWSRYLNASANSEEVVDGGDDDDEWMDDLDDFEDEDEASGDEDDSVDEQNVVKGGDPGTTTSSTSSSRDKKYVDMSRDELLKTLFTMVTLSFLTIVL